MLQLAPAEGYGELKGGTSLVRAEDLVAVEDLHHWDGLVLLPVLDRLGTRDVRDEIVALALVVHLDFLNGAARHDESCSERCFGWNVD